MKTMNVLSRIARPVTRRAGVAAIAVATLGLGVGAVEADTITLQNGLNGYTGAMDTELGNIVGGNATGDLNFGEQTFLRVREVSERILIAFDLSGVTVPAGMMLESATLSLYNYANWGGATQAHVVPEQTASVSRLLRPWIEGTGQYQAGTNDGATWYGTDGSYQSDGTGDASAAWDTPGAHGLGVDIAETATDTQTWLPYDPETELRIQQYIHWDVSGDVAAFLNAEADNYGWLIENTLTDSGGNTGAQFASSEHGSQPRPMLTLTFTPIPEPSTLGLLSAAGLALCWRRRSATAG